MTIVSSPLFNQLNLVVSDLPRAIAFWRHFGLDVEEARHPDWVRHHATVVFPNGMRLELDSEQFARQWNPGRRSSVGDGPGVLFFQVLTPEDVDSLFARMIDAGYRAQAEPKDAFWGARYAVIEDPDRNPIGIMSPTVQEKRFAPPPPPG